MKIYGKILLIALPTLVLGMLGVGLLASGLSEMALDRLAEKWLGAKLYEAMAAAKEDEEVLRRYGLETAPPNVEKAKSHAAKIMADLRIGERGQTVAIDEDGIVAACPRQDHLGRSVAKEAWFRGVREARQGRADLSWDGEAYVAVHEYFAPWGWHVLAMAPRSEVYGEVTGMKLYALGAALLGAALASLLFMALARRLTTPLRRLTEDAERIGRGDLETQILVPSGDEIGLLARTIADMKERLRESREALRQRIAEREKAEEALRKSEARYRGIIENAQEGIYQVSLDGRLLNVNPAMSGIFGYASPEEMVKELTDIRSQLYIHPGDRDGFLEEILADGRVVGGEYEFRRRDGTIIWGLINARLVCDAAGAPLMIEGFFADVTERRKAQEALILLNRDLERSVEERTRELNARARELEVANLRLRELDELKSSFLSTVSHELRTPLTSILGFVKLIGRDFLRWFHPLAQGQEAMLSRGERIRKNIAIIETEGERLARLVNDFLDLSKIESGKAEWHDQEVAIARAVERAVGAIGGQLVGKPDVELSLDIEPGLPPVLIDSDRLVQVLVNLLNNALKFTESGSITVGARLSPAGEIEVRVQDTGAGIPEVELAMVFDKFYQVGKGDTVDRRRKGSGLGLAICRHIVEHYGGHIRAESEPGAGSAFTFTIPIRKPEAGG